MENPEEVLQALDEFHKLRPSEIPRELEEYLCWVAKTGDPVYQWGLIKALFREKLMRVMTDFYESCPSLELAPCPNVDHFNYDTMKSTLLERLESFANAPFTVQRICELLTSPRKEYNRIDKFMRAIEKNILVVSTREPGSTSRRSENGDSLVNGTVDEESPIEQTSHEVEMESWVKDCTTNVVSMHEDSEGTTTENGLSVTLKDSLGKHSPTQERIQHQEVTAASFTATTEVRAEFPVTSLTSQIQAQETTPVQNLTTINHETSTIVGDVSDAIMNEDTSSQPSLDLESEDNESSEPARKLQTTFQAKDFVSDNTKSPKPYVEEDDEEEEEEEEEDEEEEAKIEEGKVEEEEAKIEKAEEIIKAVEITKEDETIVPIDSKETSDESPALEESTEKVDLLLPDSEPSKNEEDIKDEEETKDESLNEETTPLASESIEKAEEEEEPCVNNSLDLEESPTALEENIPAETDKCATDVSIRTIDETEAPKSPEVSKDEVKACERIDSEDSVCKDFVESVEEPKEVREEETKPIIEEPISESQETTEDSPKTSRHLNLTIEETVEEDTKPTNTIVPDPIPIIEEPKDAEPTVQNWESSVSVVEVTDESKTPQSEAIRNDLEEAPLENHDLAKMQDDSPKTIQTDDNQMLVSSCEEAAAEVTTTESMDVDNEVSVPVDEPMEEETTEAMNS